MCGCGVEVMMVASISIDPNKSTPPPDRNPRTSNTSSSNNNRPPLLPSEKDNGFTPLNKRPKSKQVSSRYMSPSPSPSLSSSSSSTSRRSPSPLVSRNSTPSSNNSRSVSVDRRRPLPSRPDLNPKLLLIKKGSEMSAAAKLLVTSTRSLSVSFQGEAYSFPVSKTKPQSPNLASVRKGTPERRKRESNNSNSNSNNTPLVENSKPIDQHRWPARTRQPNSLSRSLNYSADDKKSLIGSDNIIKELKQSIISDEGRRASFDGRLGGVNFGNNELLKARASFELGPTRYSLNESDSDSVSSGSNSGVQELNSFKQRNVSVSARFWQETNSRLRRLQDPGSPISTNSPNTKLIVPPKFGVSKKYPSEGLISSPRTISSPIRSNIRPSSPSKLMPSSPSRGISSPSRVRNLISGLNETTPSVLSYAVDVRRGKVGENQLIDAHLLRILYNRHLQWRFVNARAESALLLQRRSAEKNLWNAWITISGLRDSVTKKRHRLQLLRQKLKLSSILKGQITFLEGWASFEKDQFVSLLGAIEALRASTLRLPVVGGATADVENVKEAISSAVDIMQAMASSLCLLSSKADETNSLVVELAKVTAKESALLEKCKAFFSMLASMQVKNCSLRTHMLQHNRVPAA